MNDKTFQIYNFTITNKIKNNKKSFTHLNNRNPIAVTAARRTSSFTSDTYNDFKE